ncbi:MAG: hypothetical protein A2Y34_10415 [Spirochaetes bacterium GWC1_27_15]|nr:MAG: hypothetical protein A2Z98_09655 [Spirochaetes bacterium GWB1_27_13]OHD21332.1 MAG: hypothetical protein A2Y34_10415 [Spirochaetes bacterium GWC1_27_15]
MNNFTINQETIEEMHLKLNNFGYSVEKEKSLIDLRNNFKNYFNKDKINNFQKEDYYAGLGKKEGCMAYELEWGTLQLGSIKGGSKYKYGYEDDFEKIKNILTHLLSLKDNYDEFYDKNGEITDKIKKNCDESKNIKGLKTGRTVLAKLLSLYYQEVFLPIFNHQEHFLYNLFDNFIPENVGLEQFLVNNCLLLNAKKIFLDNLTDEQKLNFNNLKFTDFLYTCFPKEIKEKVNKKIEIINDDEQEINNFEALEVQHYQSLIHRNFSILFKNELKYFDEESQNPKNGHYDTEEVGEMDFLCLDKNSNFIVIELKRKATDDTIGQILRYMGWVSENLCKKSQTVRGIIIAEKRIQN